MAAEDLASVLTKHLQSLREPGADELSTQARLVHAGIPLITGVGMGIAVWRGMPISNGVAPVLSALVLLVGGMMTTFVFLTNLRVKVDESEKLSYRRKLQRLIAGTVASSLYIALLALAGALLLVLVGSVTWLRSPSAAPFTVGAVSALGSHLGISMVSVVARLWSVYHDVFFKDFGPEAGVDEVVDLPRRTKRTSST